MGRAKPVEIDTRSFRTQGEATAFFSAILQQYKPGDRVREEHEPDLRALLKRHTEYQEKLGSGTAYFLLMCQATLRTRLSCVTQGNAFGCVAGTAPKMISR